MNKIENFKKKLLAAAAEKGFESAEFFYQSSRSRKINVFGGKIEKYQDSNVGGCSFRGLYNGNMGYYYSESLDESEIDNILEMAAANAVLIENDDKEFIFDGRDAVYTKVNTFDASLTDITAEELADFALGLEKAVYSADKRVVNVLASTITTGESYISIGNTAGLDISEHSNYAFGFADCVAEENGMTKENGEFAFYTKKSMLDPEALAKAAVQKTVAMLGADSVESGSYKVIIKNEAMADLLDCYTGNFYGENVQKGFSLLKGRTGEKIASELITLTDDPHLDGGLSTTAFDSEGVPTRRNTLIENGVLKMFLHNLKSAAAADEEPTGNGFKQSFKGTVGISATNLYIKNGDKEFAELCKIMQNGLIITELSGLHSGANSISGDFSLLASGYKVQNGEIISPVEQITAAGNFYDLLNMAKAVGNDLKFNSGAVGSPSVLFDEISIAGK
ncbi:MAG: TldD/PmbA family protein [Firmicutes bacterium]|nr:TldD/PmbA family protein [Bacillota bacterium]